MAHPLKAEEDKCVKISISFDPDLAKRLIKFCQDDERTMSWCVRKALDKWLKEKDY